MRGAPAVILLVLLMLGAGAAHAQTHYVSPTGSDANDGRSPATAWRTVQHAVAQPGDRVQLLAGTYHEAVTITRSHLVLERHPSAAPGAVVLDGSRAYGAQTPRAIYHATLRILGASHVTVRGLAIANRANQEAPPPPAPHPCRLAPDAIECRINVGLEIGTRADDAAAHDIVVEDNDFTRIAHPREGRTRGAIALLVYGARGGDAHATRAIAIRGNRFHDLALSDTWNSNVILLTMNTRDVRVSGNHVRDVAATVGPRADGQPAVTIAIEAAGNTSPDADWSTARGADDHARDVIVEDNVVEKTAGGEVHGFYAQGGQRVTVERNTFRGNLVAIQAVTERPVGPSDYTRDVIIRDNLVLDSGDADLSVGNPAGARNPDYRPVENVVATNNTFYTGRDAAGATSLEERIRFYPGTLGRSRFAYNVVHAVRPLLYWSADGGANTAVLEHNVWYFDGPATERPFRIAEKGYRAYGWSAYRAATRQDAGSQWKANRPLPGGQRFTPTYTMCVRPPRPARCVVGVNPAAAKRRAKPASGSSDHTAKTPPGRSAPWARASAAGP